MLRNLLALFVCLFVSILSFSQTTYNGNGKTGFGGVVGNGSLTISNTTTDINFNFQRGTADLNDAVVIYIDSKTGGFNSTSSFSDANDALRKAISGYDGTNRSVVNFPSGFNADYAIAFDQTFGGLWELASGGNNSLNFITSVNLSPTGTTTAANYTFSISKSNIGLSGLANFTFLVTYLNPNNVFRSNEFIGDVGPASNLGYTTYNAATFNTYADPLPVKLKSFDAQKENGSNILRWTVEEEIDLKGYRIERSYDGANYSSIGFVNSAGKRNYQFNDNNKQGQVQYYRLALVDIDATTKYSNVVSVKADKVSSIILKNVFPNPVIGFANILLESPSASSIKIQVVDLSGRIVKQEESILLAGNNKIQLNTSALIPGAYTLKFISKEGLSIAAVAIIK